MLQSGSERVILYDMNAHAPHTLGESILAAFPPPAYLTMPAVGIDISDRSVKFLEFNRRRGQIELGAFGERKIPAGVVVDGEIQDVKRLSSVLAGIRRDFGFRLVRISLPEEKAYLFQGTIPADATREQAANIVEFQLEENVPVPIAEAVFDYEPIGRHAAHGKPGDEHIDVGVSVYARETVAAYAAACREAGLFPVSFEVEAQAIARSVIPEGDAGTYLIADFGRARTGVAIISDGVLRFTATLEVGGEALTEVIVNELGVSEQEAVTVKNERGFLKQRDNEELFTALMNTVTALRDEINRYLIFWNTRKDDAGASMPTVEGIILTGGNANLAGLPEYLETSLGVPTNRADVWCNAFHFDTYIPEIDFRHSLGFATGIGLALRATG